MKRSSDVHLMFDVDGTLVRSWQQDLDCYQAIASEVLGYQISDNWPAYRHISYDGVFGELLDRDGYTGEERALLCRRFRARLLPLVLERMRQSPPLETPGAAALLDHLRTLDGVYLSIMTGSWEAVSLAKLNGAGLDVAGIPVTSSDDHPERVPLMRLGQQRSGLSDAVPVIYFGDGCWDQRACDELGFQFVRVGQRLPQAPGVDDFTDLAAVLQRIGLA